MSENELLLQQIGKRIIERRKKLGLTQEALAEKGDMTTQFVSYAESGKRAMRPENLLKISSALVKFTFSTGSSLTVMEMPFKHKKKQKDAFNATLS